ncbi:hypothetical protein C4K16_0237 [Pseudomonas chlororaphis subsp. aurantiaca]|nr:hypothetical protein C4K16_0237 [Pseudomonas chlororaphis subsp. aurantiaca]AZD76830.1 hypothetical protein C4K15_0232 [Pseudomonas chlororaphis subsp. aurantiaca]
MVVIFYGEKVNYELSGWVSFWFKSCIETMTCTSSCAAN